jgi:beta-glucosidase
VYSGDFAFKAHVGQNEELRVVGGLNDYDFSWEVQPGAKFTTPEVVSVYSGDGLGGMSRAFHDLYRGYLINPRFVDQPRPIVINNWEATYFNFDTQKLCDIIDAVAGICPNTIVSLIGSSAILINEWESKVPAILFSFYGGMEGGTVLAEILFGDVNPSGKLPYTVAYNEDDYPFFDPDCTEITYEYYHGYAKMDKEGKDVLYPYGYGLSYTTFEIGKPEVSVFGDLAKISVDVTNTGDRDGAEIVQLYIGCEGSAVDRPVKTLRDFARVNLKAGETKKVELHVTKEEMAYFSEEADDFVTEDIDYVACIGNCSCEKALQKVGFRFE